MDLPKLDLEKAISMLDKEYGLVYMDYRDKLEEPKDHAQIVRTGWMEIDIHDDWIDNGQYDSAREIVNELFKDYDIEEDYDEILHTVMERDVSDPIGQLIKHTNSIDMFYDLGHEVLGYPENLEKEAKKICRKLKLKWEEKKKDLLELVGNASYGGDLVLLFRADLDDFYGEIKEKYVEIDGVELCVMDRMNGSGHSIGFGRVKIPFIRENFQVDEEAPGYSYCKDVCGMVLDTAGLRFTKDNRNLLPGSRKKIAESEASKRERRLEKQWKETGKCEAGDMNISRHKDTPYINEFPCGNRCTECGTFWVD